MTGAMMTPIGSTLLVAAALGKSVGTLLGPTTATKMVYYNQASKDGETTWQVPRSSLVWHGGIYWGPAVFFRSRPFLEGSTDISRSILGFHGASRAPSAPRLVPDKAVAAIWILDPHHRIFQYIYTNYTIINRNSPRG